MTRSKFQELERLTAMVYRARQAEMQALKTEEEKLRQSLARLEENRRQTSAQDHQDTVRQSLGADLLWQGWLDASQRDLQMQLARLLARKEPVEHRLRQSFGRDQVTQLLSIKAMLEERTIKARRPDGDG